MEIANLIVSSVSLILIPLLLWYINTKTSKKLDELKIQTEKKMQTYDKLLNFFNSAAIKNQKEINTKARLEIVIDLIKFAPDEIVKKFLFFWNKAKKELEKVDLTPIYNDILLLIRKDLGYKNTKISGNDIMELLISDKDKN